MIKALRDVDQVLSNWQVLGEALSLTRDQLHFVCGSIVH
jgi:hypothetical protein